MLIKLSNTQSSKLFTLFTVKLFATLANCKVCFLENNRGKFHLDAYNVFNLN